MLVCVQEYFVVILTAIETSQKSVGFEYKFGSSISISLLTPAPQSVNQMHFFSSVWLRDL